MKELETDLSDDRLWKIFERKDDERRESLATIGKGITLFIAIQAAFVGFLFRGGSAESARIPLVAFGLGHALFSLLFWRRFSGVVDKIHGDLDTLAKALGIENYYSLGAHDPLMVAYTMINYFFLMFAFIWAALAVWLFCD